MFWSVRHQYLNALYVNRVRTRLRLVIRYVLLDMLERLDCFLVLSLRAYVKIVLLLQLQTLEVEANLIVFA